MGRGKSKRKRLLKIKRQNKKRAGKLVRFVLANSPKKYSGWNNKYSYQSNIHNLIYKGSIFTNDKFQNCIITDCNFKKAKLTNIDFSHCNLKRTSFRGAILRNVVFFNCNMKDVDFDEVMLNNVSFICLNVNNIKNLDLASKEITIINKYPVISHSELLNSAMGLSSINQYYKYHVLNVTPKKVNNWMLCCLATQYSSFDDVARGLQALMIRKDKNGFITLPYYRR